jgi:hypothetical protein
MKNNTLQEELSKLKDIPSTRFADKYSNSLDRNTYEEFIKLYQQRLDIPSQDRMKLAFAISELGFYLQKKFYHLYKKLNNAVDLRYKELCKKYIPTDTINNWKHDNQDPGTLLEHKILSMILDAEVDKIKSQKPEFDLTHQNIANVNKGIGEKANNLFVARNSWGHTNFDDNTLSQDKEILDKVKNDTNTFKQSLNQYFIFKKNYIKLTQHTIDLIDSAAQDFQQELKNIYGNDYDSMNFNLYEAPSIKFSDEYSDSNLEDSSDNDSDANENEGSNNPHSSSDYKSPEQNFDEHNQGSGNMPNFGGTHQNPSFQQNQPNQSTIQHNESYNSSQGIDHIRESINELVDQNDPIRDNVNTIFERISNSSSNSSSNSEELREVKEQLQQLKHLVESYSNARGADKEELQQQIDWLKSSYDNQNKQLKELVTSFEQPNDKLQDYYKGFVSALTCRFTSAQAVLAEDLKVDGTKNLPVKISVQFAKLIPLFGGNISDGIQLSADYKVVVEVQKKSMNLVNFAMTQSKFEKWAKYMANSLNEKSAEYIENYKISDNSGIISKFKKFTKETKDSADNQVAQIEVQEPSPQAFLGNEHAKKLLEEYIYTGKYRQLDQDNLIDNIMELFLVDLAKEIAEDNQQKLDQIYSSSSLVDQKDDGELTPKSKQIKEMQEEIDTMQAMFQAQLEEANKLNIEKDNRIKELEENPDTDKWISKDEVVKIMESSKSEMDNIMSKNNQVIQSLQQETLEKDDIIQKQADENGDLSNKLIIANDTIQELKVEKLAKDKRIDKLEIRNEKLEVNNDIKDDKIKKLMDELHEERTKNLKNVSDTNSNKTIMERCPDTISPNNILPEQHEEAKIGGDFEDFNVDLQ